MVKKATAKIQAEMTVIGLHFFSKDNRLKPALERVPQTVTVSKMRHDPSLFPESLESLV
jgi:hypothetical protein